tara:strand:+ start:1072 stop:1374 length:303 start_codon:yes stop_codon:yes gene_type:complete
MKTQHAVFVWNVIGKKELRVFPVGEVELQNFSSDYTADGAVHDHYRLLNDKEAIEYLSCIIKNLLTQGYQMDMVHFQSLGIDGYKAALQILQEELEASRN